jgi:long-chain fatty acid transport protein
MFWRGLILSSLLVSFPVRGNVVALLAQTNDSTFDQFQFNFSAPGARASAMGGAFIGLADDATAAVTNPAGLVSLRKTQVYLEYKHSNPSIARLALPNSLSTGETSRFGDEVDYISFANIAAPLGGRATVAFTYHRFLNFKETFHLSPRPIPNTTQTYFPVDGSTDFRGEEFGGSLALKLHEGFSLGVTISGATLRAAATATRRGFTTGPSGRQESPVIANRTSISSRDNGVGGAIGFLGGPWQGVSVGLRYSHGAKFGLQENHSVNPGFPTINSPLTPLPSWPKGITFDVPNRLGGGLAYRPEWLSRLLIVADIARTRYSDLTRDFTLVFTSPGLTAQNYEIVDANELHFGGEWNLIRGERLLYLRAGGLTNPDHGLSYKPTGNAQTDVFENALYNTRSRRTELGYTVGIGLTIGQHFQWDAAYVDIKSFREFVSSVAVRF